MGNGVIMTKNSWNNWIRCFLSQSFIFEGFGFGSQQLVTFVSVFGIVGNLDWWGSQLQLLLPELSSKSVEFTHYVNFNCRKPKSQLSKKFVDFIRRIFSLVNSYESRQSTWQSQQSHSAHAESTLSSLGKCAELRLSAAFAENRSTPKQGCSECCFNRSWTNQL